MECRILVYRLKMKHVMLQSNAGHEDGCMVHNKPNQWVEEFQSNRRRSNESQQMTENPRLSIFFLHFLTLGAELKLGPKSMQDKL